MKKALEKLWNEYLSDSCAAIDTEEERRYAKRVAALYEEARASLSEEQEAKMEKYVDTLCDMEALYVQKAFCKGCEFTFSFLLGAGALGK